jgi:predicted Zn-dependent peptidase
MLFGATQNETERTLAMRIAQSGGSLRIEWTPAGALITAYARPDSVVNVLSLLKEALFRAEFSDDALQRARQHALYDRRFPEGGLAWRLTARLVGGYADKDALARVRLDDIRAYYRAHYRPQNAVIAIAGNYACGTAGGVCAPDFRRRVGRRGDACPCTLTYRAAGAPCDGR